MSLIRVGLIGTGYAAKLRAENLVKSDRSQLIYVAGHQQEKTAEFAQGFGAEAIESWQELVSRSEVDLVVIANVNRDHTAIGRAALAAGKHVVMEYPLALDYQEAVGLVELAQQQEKLLHVEHIELLSGIHTTVKAVLPEIGTPFYARSTSFNAQRPAPQKWTYQLELFGFPLVGALSRIHRLTNLFGPVARVSGQARFWYESEQPPTIAPSGSTSDFFKSCLCTAQLQFESGLVADLVYGKGEAIWQSGRSLEVHGEKGAIELQGETGQLITAAGSRSLSVGSRRGLFAKDTAMVLDYLTLGTPLYVSLTESLAALQVADAIRRSAETNAIVVLSS